LGPEPVFSIERNACSASSGTGVQFGWNEHVAAGEARDTASGGNGAGRPGVGGEGWIWAVALLIHLLFWVSLRTHWLVPLFNDSVHRFGPGADFFALYQAGWSALRGQSIYEFAPGETVIPYAYPFRYLPISAYTVGALLTLAPPTVAYALWLAVCELCLLQNVRLTYQRAGRGVRGARLGAVWLIFCPYFLELWIGQFTFVLGSLLFWTVLACETGRGKAAQGWWIASVLWKPASLLWAPIWLRERRWWPGLLLCGLLLAGNLFYFRFFPADWPLFLETNFQSMPTWHAGNVGLSGLVYHFTGPSALFHAVRVSLSLALVLPALWITLRPLPRERRPPFWLLASLWTCLYFLVYKDVWEHHLTLLLPFLVLALWRSPTPLLIGLVILLALPSPFVLYDPPGLGFNVDPQPFFSSRTSLLHHSWRVVPLLALYGLWLKQACRRGP
jgi:hypothetical protein